VTKDFLAHLTPPATGGQRTESGIVRWSASGGKYTLRFNGTLTDKPILSKLSRNFDIEFNIRAGGIQNLSENKVGTLVTDITGDEAEVERALDYLRQHGIIVEYDGEAMKGATEQ
jgi:D-methionine transport system ATP-binding protein